MKSLLVLLISLGCVWVCQAATCSYSCTQQVKYYTSCGFFGWSRCTRYRSQASTCSRTCEHGAWSAWSVSSRSTCTRTCAVGTQTVTSVRTCTNPAPSNGGNPCTGSSTMTEQQSCNTQQCPIHGGWTAFSVASVSPCSKSCGGGQQTVTSTRTCTNPAPLYGGNNCVNSSTQSAMQVCNSQPCPIDGGWIDWENWQDYDECTVLCGSGTIDQWRMRTCTNPAPQYGGADCVGPNKENGTHACNTAKCGDKCPEGQSTYIAKGNNTGRYYQCDNGVARRMECAAGTVWDQASTTCVNDGSQKVPEVKQGDQCDPAQTYYAHSDCSKFIMCVSGVAYEMSCPGGLRFNVAITGCDFAANVPCP